MGLDLLLVNNGGFRKKIYQNLNENYSAIEPPFWAALTADFIRGKGFNVGVLDANAENLSQEEMIKKISEYEPKFVSFVMYGQHPSASTALMNCSDSSIALIKKNLGKESPKVIYSGVHPSALPEKTLRESESDFVIEGEGFYTLLGLLNNQEYSDIPGLWIKEGNNIIPPKKKCDLVKNLDEELPSVAWDLLPMDKYLAHNWHCLGDLESRKSYASISTTLGCPYNCSFCCINSPFGKPSYRMWSPEWTLRQVDILTKKYGVKNLKIIDELFVLNPNHFAPIAKELEKYGLNIWAYARVDTAKEEYLDILKKAGINWLGIGIESGANQVRKDVTKGKFDDYDIKKIVSRISNAGINTAANYIFGLPTDTHETMQQTLDLAKELNCEWANFYSAMAYPGSQLHNEYLGKGVLPEEIGIGWEGYSQHSYETYPLPTKTLSSMEVLKFRDKSFNDYFTNPEYLKKIENKFGVGAREHIQNMTKIKLKRKILGN